MSHQGTLAHLIKFLRHYGAFSGLNDKEAAALIGDKFERGHVFAQTTGRQLVSIGGLQNENNILDRIIKLSNDLDKASSSLSTSSVHAELLANIEKDFTGSRVFMNIEFQLKENLTQGDFEALEMALFKMPNLIQMLRRADVSVAHGAYLRAAIQAGWIIAPECRALTDDKSGERAFFYTGKDVEEMHPSVVRWLGQRVIDRHDAIMSEDPKNL
jgi:hypothetical protein